ncbi:class I SAM-dependent methyltransferase [Falsiroseomonas sp. CW058]|uniref:class I SAM-dependent methyltransferase n=1 Tax=Falsiroseomonas sp. CW058 TaxID=3388664 RepID=UPI003D319ECB
MRILADIGELDEMIAACDAAEAVSDDALRAVFATFRMEPPPGGADPFSPEYRAAEMRLYETIAGRPYSTANEVTAFDVAQALRAPFPFSTGSTATAGEHFAAMGMLLRAMPLPRGARVLEFGPGWGNTTLALARLGHRVTAVDIEPHFCELLRRRAAAEEVALEVVNDDFLWAEEAPDAAFDAVVFFECFHHCADHLRLLAALPRILAPGGRVLFGAEPIQPDFPRPWGLRLDGSSLWAIRRNGWLELGFRDDYFRAALARAGLAGRRIASADLPWLSVWEARKAAELGLRWGADAPEIRTAAAVKRGGAVAFDGRAGTLVFGPYAALPAGRWRARMTFRAAGTATGRARMDVSAGAGARVLAARPLTAAAILEGGLAADLPFEAAEDLEGVEVRLHGEGRGLFDRGFGGVELLAVEILPVG